MARGTSKGDLGPMALEAVKAEIKYEVDNIISIVQGFEGKLPGFSYEEFRKAPTDVQITKKPGSLQEFGLKSVFLNPLNLNDKRDRKMLKEMVMHDVIKRVGKAAKMTYDGIARAPDEVRPTLTFALTVNSENDVERVSAAAMKAIKAFQVRQDGVPRDFFGEVIIRDKQGKQLDIKVS